MKKAKPGSAGNNTASSKAQQLLNKTPFLSRSQDNLASQLRRKAVAAALSQKEAANNKENLSQKEKSAASASRASKQAKGGGSGTTGTGNNAAGTGSQTGSGSGGAPMPTARPNSTSASSAAAVAATVAGGGSADQPIKRAQSAQNIDKTSAAPAGPKTPGSVKRASSTQNISSGKGVIKVRQLARS